MDWLTLKSGSDVRGTAVGEGAVLTDEVALALGAAFIRKLCAEKGKKASEITISLGRDSRISGPALLAAAAEGIRKAGAVAIDFGMCTTPAMFMSTITDGFRTDGAIMITASHHPWNKNGLKFFTEKGGLEGNEISELLRDAQAPHDELHEEGEIRQIPFLPVYMKQLADRIRKGLGTTDQQPLRGLQVAVDAGNGAGGFYAELMEQLGASNRAAIVDGDGKAINRNRLIALISAILLEEKKGQTIVTDSVTSSGLADFIREHGGRHYRFKRGYRNVIDEAIRLNREGESCPLAIETSGHAALRENHFLDDGMYLVTVLIIRAMIMKRRNDKLGSLIADLREPVESTEIRLNITDQDFRTIGEKVIRSVLDYAGKDPDWHIAPDNREGIRISFDLNDKNDAGWFLLRLSVHDPVMPLNAESDIPGGVKDMLQRLYNVISDSKGIDLTPLKQAAGVD